MLALLGLDSFVELVWKVSLVELMMVTRKHARRLEWSADFGKDSLNNEARVKGSI